MTGSTIRPRVAKTPQGRKGKRRFTKRGGKVKQSSAGSVLSRMASGQMY